MVNPFFLKFLSNPEEELTRIIRAVVRNELTLSNEQLSKKKEEDLLLTRKDAAKYLQISLTGLYSLQKEGMINFYRLGKKVFFKKSELQQLYQSRK